MMGARLFGLRRGGVVGMIGNKGGARDDAPQVTFVRP